MGNFVFLLITLSETECPNNMPGLTLSHTNEIDDNIWQYITLTNLVFDKVENDSHHPKINRLGCFVKETKTKKKKNGKRV